MLEFAWTIDVQMLKVLLKVLRSKSLILYFYFPQFSLPPYMLCSDELAEHPLPSQNEDTSLILSKYYPIDFMALIFISCVFFHLVALVKWILMCQKCVQLDFSIFDSLIKNNTEFECELHNWDKSHLLIPNLL